MSADPLLPVLAAVAEVVLSRPALAGDPRGPEQFAAEERDLVLKVLTIRRLREEAQSRLRLRREQKAERDLADVVLASDDAIAAAGLRLAMRWTGGAQRAAEERRHRRHRRDLDELRTVRDRALGRLEDAEAELRATRAALTDAEQRAEGLEVTLATLQHRLRDPRYTASALLAAVRPVPESTQDDAESRDPRQTAAPPSGTALGLDPDSPAARAAKAAGIDPDAFRAALDALVTPPVEAAPEPPRPRVTAELDLRVVPLGGGTEIGGSCLLVEAGGTRLLIDAGLRPKEPAVPPGVDQLKKPPHAVVVTHAHNDHCGYVPLLIRRFPDLPVLATQETVRLMPVMWTDAARLMDHGGRAQREWGGDGTALYGQSDVRNAARRCEELPYGVAREVGGLTVELFPAGHILGAAGVVVRAGDRRVVVTGDISGFRQESVDGYALPEAARYADLLVMESTCCAEDHTPRETRVGDLVRAVEEVCTTGGRVLIPAFALGRAQELALIMHRRLEQVPVLLDGMAANIGTHFESLTADRSDPLHIFGDGVRRAKRPIDLTRFTRGVVITTSGMLTGGPALDWAAHILPESGSALFLSGYQDEESGGAHLTRLVENGAKHIDLDGRKVPLRARTERMRLSAHADRRGLLDIADEVGAQQVMLVHGLPRRQRDFADVLAIRGHDTVPTDLWRA